jgi:undecaprenyl phosphate-alpha-L-ara4N flippase subunit ArnE
MATKANGIILVVICTFITSYVHVMWKMIASRPFVDILTGWELWVGFVLLAFGAAILITALKHGDVSVLYPIISTSYIWVTILSNYYFAEPITGYKWAGVFGVVIGLTVLGKGNKEAERNAD